jgi:hypothetical protein
LLLCWVEKKTASDHLGARNPDAAIYGEDPKLAVIVHDALNFRVVSHLFRDFLRVHLTADPNENNSGRLCSNVQEFLLGLN